MRYNEITPKKISKKAAKEAETLARYERERELAEAARKKVDAFKDAVAPYMGKQEINAITFWHYMNTPKGKATFTLKEIYGATEPRMELFWLLAADRGAGRAAMEIICDLADKHGVILELDAIPLKGMQNDLKLKQSQLDRFYHSFGFKTEKNKKAKYPHMVRHPKGETISEGTSSTRTFYHGSDHKITAFSLDHLGSGQGADQEGPGIYLTSSKKDACMYGKYIHTIAVSIPKSRILGKKKALRTGVEILIRSAPNRDETLQNWDEDPRIAFHKAVDVIMDSYGDDRREAYESVWGDFYRDHSADYLKKLIRFGYDGFELPRADGIVHLIAFNPAKLKIVAVEERITEGEKKHNPAKQFMKAVKNDQKCSDCDFTIENKNEVFLAWLSGGNGLVPHVTAIADLYGVTLTLSVEIYSANDGGRLVQYYEKNGFVVIGTDFDEKTDLNTIKSTGELLGTVHMQRKAGGRPVTEQMLTATP
jgi:GNAT superfamily N-acetyltransferase